MRHFVVIVLAIAVSPALTLPLAAQGAGEAQAPAGVDPQAVVGRSVVRGDLTGISGVVATPDGQPLPNVVVRARNLLTNEINGSTRTAEKGEYAFLNLRAGNYVLEVIDDDSAIIGTSAFVAAKAGAIVSGLTVTAAGGVLNAVSTTTGLVAALGTAARSVTAAAAAAGVAGVVVPPEVPIASPSR